MNLLPTRDALVTHYGVSLTCVSKEQDPDDDSFYIVTLVQTSNGDDDDVVPERTRFVFSGPADVLTQYREGSVHFASADIETTV